MKTIYQTQGTCSKAIEIDYDPATDIVNSVNFIGGCPGNTVGVASLAKGRKAAELISLLEGVQCRDRGTSCPDQFAKALRIITQNQPKA